METIYVLAPNHQQAVYWLKEFGTNPRGRNVIVVPAPRRRAGTSDDLPSPPDKLRGRRWQEGDEFLIVGNEDDLDWSVVCATANWLDVPHEEFCREREAARA